MVTSAVKMRMIVMMITTKVKIMVKIIQVISKIVNVKMKGMLIRTTTMVIVTLVLKLGVFHRDKIYRTCSMQFTAV